MSAPLRPGCAVSTLTLSSGAVRSVRCSSPLHRADNPWWIESDGKDAASRDQFGNTRVSGFVVARRGSGVEPVVDSVRLTTAPAQYQDWWHPSEASSSRNEPRAMDTPVQAPPERRNSDQAPAGISPVPTGADPARSAACHFLPRCAFVRRKKAWARSEDGR